MKASPGIAALPLLIAGLITVAIASVIGIGIYRQSNPAASLETLETRKSPQPSATNTSLSQATPTDLPLTSPPPAPPAGQKAIHQKIAKDTYACFKNQTPGCVCTYGTKTACSAFSANPRSEAFLYVLAQHPSEHESNYNLLEDITASSSHSYDCKPHVVYRTRNVVEAVDGELHFLYEDGAWRIVIESGVKECP